MLSLSSYIPTFAHLGAFNDVISLREVLPWKRESAKSLLVGKPMS